MNKISSYKKLKTKIKEQEHDIKKLQHDIKLMVIHPETEEAADIYMKYIDKLTKKEE